MNATEYLEKDNSYLVVPRNSIWRNLKFWKQAKIKNGPTEMAGSIGNQREAYESGVKIGWETGVEEMRRFTKFPYNMTLGDKEYQDFMSLLTVFGYRFIYCPYTPAKETSRNFHPGLNIVKDYKAIKMGYTISENVKQQVYKILKENSNSELWTF